MSQSQTAGRPHYNEEETQNTESHNTIKVRQPAHFLSKMIA